MTTCRRAKTLNALIRISVVALIGCGTNAKFRTDGSHDGPNTGDDAGAETAAWSRRLCDGSRGIRFMYRIAPNVSRVLAFTPVLRELGDEFLFVDGMCHYWVKAPSSISSTAPDFLFSWRPYHEGQLSANQEQALHDMVGYDNFLKEGPRCSVSSAVDASIQIVWDGATSYSCYGPLGTSDIWWPMRETLYSQGVPLAGSLRIEMGVDEVPDRKLYQWPLDTDPGSMILPYEKAFEAGQGTSITVPRDVAALRALRESFLNDNAIEKNPGELILLQPKGLVLSIRDELPFAGADGLWNPR
jgi:hypothetical protein